jgi:hypothetical protein
MYGVRLFLTYTENNIDLPRLECPVVRSESREVEATLAETPCRLPTGGQGRQVF